MINRKVWVKSNFGRKVSVRGWEWETWEPSVIQTSQGELLVLKKTDSNLLVSMWPEKALVSLFLPDKTETFSYMSHVNMNFQIWLWLWHMYTFKCDTHTSSYRVSYLYIFVQCVIIHPGMAFVYLASSNPALLVSSPLPPFPYTPSSSGHRSRWTPSSPSSSSTPSTTSSSGHRSRWRSFTSW